MFRKVMLMVAIAAGHVQGEADTEIKLEDPATLAPGAFAEFSVKLDPGDKVKWKVTPEPLRKKVYGDKFVVDGEIGRPYLVEVEIVNFKTEKWLGASAKYTFGGTLAPPKKDEPTPKKPEDPVVPPPSQLYYFMVVRPNAPADPAYTKLMADPAWNQLRMKGHQIKEFTRDEAAKWVTVPEIPPVVVVTLGSKTVNGETKSVVLRPAIPVPTTSDTILKLPEGVQ